MLEKVWGTKLIRRDTRYRWANPAGQGVLRAPAPLMRLLQAAIEDIALCRATIYCPLTPVSLRARTRRPESHRRARADLARCCSAPRCTGCVLRWSWRTGQLTECRIWASARALFTLRETRVARRILPVAGWPGGQKTDLRCGIRWPRRSRKTLAFGGASLAAAWVAFSQARLRPVSATTIPLGPFRIIPPVPSARAVGRKWRPPRHSRACAVARFKSLSLSCISPPGTRICQAGVAAPPQLRKRPAPAIPRDQPELQKAADVPWLKGVIAAIAIFASAASSWVLSGACYPH